MEEFSFDDLSNLVLEASCRAKQIDSTIKYSTLDASATKTFEKKVLTKLKDSSHIEPKSQVENSASLLENYKKFNPFVEPVYIQCKATSFEAEYRLSLPDKKKILYQVEEGTSGLVENYAISKLLDTKVQSRSRESLQSNLLSRKIKISHSDKTLRIELLTNHNGNLLSQLKNSITNYEAIHIAYKLIEILAVLEKNGISIVDIDPCKIIWNNENIIFTNLRYGYSKNSIGDFGKIFETLLGWAWKGCNCKEISSIGVWINLIDVCNNSKKSYNEIFNEFRKLMKEMNKNFQNHATLYKNPQEPFLTWSYKNALKRIERSEKEAIFAYNSLALISDYVTGTKYLHLAKLRSEDLFGVANYFAIRTERNIGYFFMQSGKYEIALRYFKKVKKGIVAYYGEKNNKEKEINHMIGFLYKMLGCFKKATFYLNKSKKMHNWEKPKILPHLENVNKIAGQEESKQLKNIFTLVGQGIQYASSGQYNQCKELLRKAETNALNTFSENNSYLYKFYYHLGVAANNVGLMSDSKVYFEKAEKGVHTFAGETDVLAEFYENMAIIYRNLQDFPKALEYMQKSIKFLTEATFEKSEDLINSYFLLGKIHEELGDVASAIKSYLNAENFARSVNEYNTHLPVIYIKLANLFCSTEDYLNSIKFYEKVIRYLKLTFEGNDKTIDKIQVTIAKMQGKIGDFQNMFKNQGEIVQRMKKPTGEDAKHFIVFGVLHGMLGKYQEGLSYIEKGISFLCGECVRCLIIKAKAFADIGVLYIKMGGFKKGINYIYTGLNSLNSVLSQKDPTICIAYNNIGGTYAILGNYNEAIKYYNLAENAFKATGKKSNTLYHNLGCAFHILGKEEEAFKYFEMEQKIYEEKGQGNKDDISENLENINIVCQSIERNDEKAQENIKKPQNAPESLNTKSLLPKFEFISYNVSEEIPQLVVANVKIAQQESKKNYNMTDSDQLTYYNQSKVNQKINVALSYAQSKKYPEAIKILKEIEQSHRGNTIEDCEILQNAYEVLTNIYYEIGDKANYIAYQAKIQQISYDY